MPTESEVQLLFSSARERISTNNLETTDFKWVSRGVPLDEIEASVKWIASIYGKEILPNWDRVATEGVCSTNWEGIDGLKPVPIFYSGCNIKNRARFVINIDKLDSAIALYGRFRER